MNLFYEIKQLSPAKVCLLVGLILFGSGLSSRIEANHKREVQIRLAAVARAQQLQTARLFLNMKNQFTPGFRFEHPLREAGTVTQSQGEIFKTQTSTHLAINGCGYFALREGKKLFLTRDGRFSFQDGTLRSQDGRVVLGYPLEDGCQKLGALEPDEMQTRVRLGTEGRYEQMEIRLGMDPMTKLYGGKYIGFHYDEWGILYGESVQMDPVTGQRVTSSTPLYQIAIAQITDKGALRVDGPDTRVEPGLLSSEIRNGTTYCRGTALLAPDKLTDIRWSIPGEMASVCPGSLEMSNVDFVQQGELAAYFSRYGALFCDFPGRAERGFLRLSYSRPSDVPGAAPLDPKNRNIVSLKTQ